jgi:gas vesicle protein
MADVGKILSAVALGAVAGAALGVLFAPDKGSETRRRISEKSQDLVDQLSEKIDEGMSVLSNLRRKADDIKNKASGFAMEGSEGEGRGRGRGGNNANM